MARLQRNWKAEEAGRALATELHVALEISHRQAKGLIDAGCVQVGGVVARSHGHRLAAGEVVAVDFDASRAYAPMARPSRSADAPFDLLFEDPHLVFVNKPAGLLTVPAEKGNEPTLADALTDHYRRRGLKRVQLYVVHRLDRWTSGVLVFAKTPEAMHGLKAIFEAHRLQRVYKAVLVGELPENSGTLSGRIVENPKSLRMRVVQPRPGDTRPRGAKEAVTHYRVMERLPGHTVVEVKLETGRRNQIRVQFADRGYPLLGDQVYGQASDLLDRQALHAELLGFRHPVTEEPVSATAPLPADLESALKALRLRQRLRRAEAGQTGEEGLFRPRLNEDRKQDRVRRAKRYRPAEDPEAPAPQRDRPGDRRPGRSPRPSTGRPPRPRTDRPGKPEGRPSGPRGDRPGRPEGRSSRPRAEERPGRPEGRPSGPRGEQPGRPEGRPAGPRSTRAVAPKDRPSGPRAGRPEQDRPTRARPGPSGPPTGRSGGARSGGPKTAGGARRPGAPRKKKP